MDQRNRANGEGRQQRLYSCRYCDKTFTTWQALGGHQNGHNWERNLANNQVTAQDPNYRYLFLEHNQPPPPIFPPISAPPPLPVNVVLARALATRACNDPHPSASIAQCLARFPLPYAHLQPNHFNNNDHKATSNDLGGSSSRYVIDRDENGRNADKAGKEDEIDLTPRL